ncbi:MAG: hypothetical protein IPK82_27115 [Polyangiaceae bacterium]|nr:hypothetical protein [Polyangiaceae bacterium]
MTATSADTAPAHPLAKRVADKLGVPQARVDLTLLPVVQSAVDEAAKTLVEEQHPVAFTVIVLDPPSGEVLGLAEPDMASTPRVTGSTMKSLTVAAALDEGVVALDDSFFCDNGKRDYGGKFLSDAFPAANLTVSEILMMSSNIGTARIFDKLGGQKFGAWLRKFHFGDPEAIPLAPSSIEPVPQQIADGSLEGAEIAGGHLVRMASPFHLAAVYASFANGGFYNRPTLVKRVRDADGKVASEHAPENERLFKPETAAVLRKALERVVHDEKGTGKNARVEGMRVAGKTGTFDEKMPSGETLLYGTFVGFAPAESPRYLIFVSVLSKDQDGTGGKLAAPTFSRIAKKLMAH